MTLPIAHDGRRGGYFRIQINDDNYNLFTGIPCFGVTADVLEAEAAAEVNNRPIIPICPEHTRPTENLCGYISTLPGREPEARNALIHQGIEENDFAENIPHTRFNIINYIDSKLEGNKTFRSEDVNIRALTRNGVKTLVIKTLPSENPIHTRWTQAVVAPICVKLCRLTTLPSLVLLTFVDSSCIRLPSVSTTIVGVPSK